MTESSMSPYVLVSKHAIQRARERIPYFRWKTDANIESILVAIAKRGPDYGEAILDGECFKLGKTHCNKPIVLAIREDRDGRVNAAGQPHLIVTTVLTPEEAHAAGGWRKSE